MYGLRAARLSGHVVVTGGDGRNYRDEVTFKFLSTKWHLVMFTGVSIWENNSENLVRDRKDEKGALLPCGCGCSWQEPLLSCWYCCQTNKKTLPKAQRTRGLSSYHKITVHKSWAYYNFRISIKHLLQNLNQTSASRLNLKLKSWPNLASEYWPRFNFVTSTKHQQQNTDQTSASKSRLNFNYKILTSTSFE